MPSPRSIKLFKSARRAADRTVLSVVNALAYFGDDTPSTLGSAAKDVVFERGKLTLYRLRPLQHDEYELGHGTQRVESNRIPIPLLIIPPLMVRPYVYDLRPEHSMLRTLRNAGFDVFVLDFGVPDETDRDVDLDDYVLDYVPSCVEETLRVSGASGLAMVGYCMGGLFALLHAATFHDPRVRAIVTIGSPVDFTKLGVMTVAARLGAPGVDRILDLIGNIPGSLSSFGFKIMSGTRAVTKWSDLLMNLYDEDYVRGFNAINYWVNDMIPYPREAFRQMFKEVVYANKLLNGELTFGGRSCRLDHVTAPLLAFAGQTDNIATPASTRGIINLIGAQDKQLIEVPGGHVAVVAGSHAPDKVWTPMMAWLSERLVETPSPTLRPSQAPASMQRPSIPSTSVSPLSLEIS